MIIILLILLFILLVYTPHETLYNGNKWGNYRIGDVFIKDLDSKWYSDSYEYNILNHPKDYPGSIAAEYMKKATKTADLDVLKQIVNSRTVLAPVNDLILHIRVGDVLCYPEEDQREYSKVNDPGWWDRVIEYTLENGLTIVHILSGAHYDTCIDKSKEYLADRVKFLEKNNLQIKYRLGEPPDDDIVFCNNAKHFISTGGNFGKLLKLVTSSGNFDKHNKS
jgi:hypothetical protein